MMPSSLSASDKNEKESSSGILKGENKLPNDVKMLLEKMYPQKNNEIKATLKIEFFNGELALITF
jgi:hypothetical protein